MLLFISTLLYSANFSLGGTVAKKEGAQLKQTPCNLLDLHTICMSWGSTTTLDLSFLVTSIRLQTPCKLLYTHTTCAHGLPQFWTQNLNLVPLFSKNPGTTYFRPLASSLPTRHPRRHNLLDQKTLDTHSTQKPPICPFTRCNKRNFTDSLLCWSLVCSMFTSLIVLKNL